MALARAEWRGVLAGAYRARSWRPKSVPEPTTLAHLVLLDTLNGKRRLHRDPGETMCKRVPAEHMADVYATTGEDYCGRCKQMAERYGVEIVKRED